MRARGILVNLAGTSGAGKSRLAAGLAETMSGQLSVLPLDAYYRDLSGWSPEAIARWSFDEPEALDWHRIVTDIGQLLHGKAVSLPEYDFVTHSRRPSSTVVLPAPVLLVEGLFALHPEALRAGSDLRLFLDVPDPVCLSRRLGRDVQERGRRSAEVEEQFFRDVAPAAARWIRPSGSRAHRQLDGQQHPAQLVEQCLSDIRRLMEVRGAGQRVARTGDSGTARGSSSVR